MYLVNQKNNLFLTWPTNCVSSEENKEVAFAITDTKIFVLVVTLSTQDKDKLLRQLN